MGNLLRVSVYFNKFSNADDQINRSQDVVAFGSCVLKDKPQITKTHWGKNKQIYKGWHFRCEEQCVENCSETKSDIICYRCNQPDYIGRYCMW